MKIAVLFIIIFLPITLFAQSNPIVQVDPVINLSDEVWLDAVCDAATDNVLFTLKFLGQFNVKSDTPEEGETDPLINTITVDKDTFDTAILKTRAEAEGYDNILFGSCTIEYGSYIITMNAYDLALDKITYSGSTVVESIFDTFEAVDEITYLTVEGFSGIHVTYGSLVLVPPDTGEPFSFTIDGIALPEGIFSVDRMPAGVHELAVRQERPFGLYEAVHEIVVEEEKKNRINIILPNITGEEIDIFSQADKYLTLIIMHEESVVVSKLDDIRYLLNTLFFQKFRPGLIQKYDKWVSMLEGEVLVTDKTNSWKVSRYIRSPWDSEMQKGVSTNEVSLSSNRIIKQSTADISASNKFLLANIETIKIDGDGADWNNITSSYNDPLNDYSRKSKDHMDIKQIKFAIDHKYLYIFAETVSGFNSSDYMFNWHTIDSTHVLYFDFFHWKGEREVEIIIGYAEHGSDKHQRFERFEQQTKAEYGKIFEAAIPLNYLMDFPLFTEIIEIRGRTEDWTVGESFDVDEFNFTLQLPLLEAMVKKDET